LTDDPDGFANGQRNLTAPNGTRIEIDELNLPPEKRHRVMYASNNIEVIEIGVPAEHVTEIDHEMELPNGVTNTSASGTGRGL